MIRPDRTAWRMLVLVGALRRKETARSTLMVD